MRRQSVICEDMTHNDVIFEDDMGMRYDVRYNDMIYYMTREDVTM